MSRGPGTHLGPYEILSALGAGGMGEVWRARDTKLNRDVAIKVLLPAVANDPERLARFSREAQVLALLNHPNISAILGLEDSTGVPALVMELVEGPTLADRIAQGPIPLAEALPIAKQIAEALEAAHEQGVIHRDLKPANVKVKANGTVKVLDFGLAKALDPAPAAAANLANSPTLTMQATQAGIILGTAAYMSPEQAAGKSVDKRTDLWAFGVVLMEMLTGRPVFPGETVSHVLASVLKSEPDWTSLPAETSAPIRRVLRRCLEKNPKRRLESAADAGLEIEDALATPAAEVATPAVGLERSSSRGTHVLFFVTVAALVVATGLAVPTLKHLREAPPVSPPEARVDIVTPAANSQDAFALAPDGRSIVFVASGENPSRLWLRVLSSTAAQPLAGTEGAEMPFWSPNGRSIGFVASGELKRIDVGGGSAQTVTSPAFPLGATWSTNGVILFSQGVGRLFRVSATGGKAVPATTLSTGQTSQGLPVLLPDGRHFLFGAVGAPDAAGVYVSALDADHATKLTGPDVTPGGWYLPAGWLLWVRGNSLVAQRLDLDRQALTGDPVTVTDSLSGESKMGLPLVSVSATGLIAYRSATVSGRQVAWFDRTGKMLGTLGALDENLLSGIGVSPLGGRAAVSRIVQGNLDIWLLDGLRVSRLTFDAADDVIPIWSPDGSRIVYTSSRTGRGNLYEKPATGAGTETLVVDSPEPKFANDWSRDGRFLLYHTIDPKSNRDLWVQPMDGQSTPWPFLQTPFDERWGRFSPDGHWVAYESNESGRSEIYIRPFAPNRAQATAAGQWQISTAGGISPTWRADGQELFYLAPVGDLMAVPISTRGTSLQPGTPVPLFRPPIFGGTVNSGRGWQYDVARDGRFLINTIVDKPGVSPVTLIQNWTPPRPK